jgi:SET domain
MSLSNGKRPRSDGNRSNSIEASAAIPEEAACFAPLVSWVTARGGFVHPALFLDVRRTLRATTRLPAGTLLMRIPAVSAVVDDTDGVTSSMDPCHGASEHALAWYLAQKPASLRPYVASLPDAIDLPHLWPPEVWQQLLTGSPVLRYIEKTQPEQLQSQYQAAVEERPNGAHRPPSWDEYRWAHALVTSRAFDDDDDAAIYMVPVLDLCNHGRGTESKNVAYTGTTTPEGSRMVEGTTTCDLAPHEALRITYGAKPNSVLLVNYGFALRQNVEPDGSSNDVLELYRGDNDEAPLTVLRTGPPAYTYGCFTTAVQSFYLDECTEEGTAVTDHRDESALEDFWNDCDAEENDTEEEEEENDSADEAYEDLLYQDLVPSITDPNKTNGSTKQKEVKALRKFRQYLVHLAGAYTLPQQANWSSLLQEETDPSRDVYDARLIGSELRILQFYIWATARLERRLDTADIPVPPSLVPLEPDDVHGMDRHIEELIAAYMQLRHAEEAL